MTIVGETNIGLVRENNQDACAYAVLSNDCGYALVCDGMGGANGGNIASKIAVEALEGRMKSLEDNYKPENLLSSAMVAANISILDFARQNPDLEGMGTTVVALLIRDNIAYISHVGDSRLYLFRQHKLSALTRDHSVVQEMIEQGQITPEEAKTHPRRHFITRALGVTDYEDGEYDEFPLEKGDRLILCTDGLTNMVEDSEIARLLENPSPEEAVSDLIQQALDNGGADNITVVLADI